MRFYRGTPSGRWESPTRPVASEEVYLAKPITLHPGQNWVAFPGDPDTNTVDYVFGPHVNSLPSGISPPSSTRVYWYNRHATGDNPSNLQQAIWLDNGAWVTDELSPQPAGDLLIDPTAGMVIELPGTSPATLLFVGRVPTNSQTQVMSPGTFNLVSTRLPRRLHPSQMNLLESGFEGGPIAWDPNLPEGQFPVDLIWKWDRQAQGIPLASGGFSQLIYYNTTSQEWVFLTGGTVPNNYFGPDDGIVILVSPNTTEWTWTNTITYTPPSRFLD